MSDPSTPPPPPRDEDGCANDAGRLRTETGADGYQMAELEAKSGVSLCAQAWAPPDGEDVHAWGAVHVHHITKVEMLPNRLRIRQANGTTVTVYLYWESDE